MKPIPEQSNKRIDYATLAEGLRMGITALDGVKEVTGNFVDDLRGSIYVGRRRHFNGIEFQETPEGLLIAITVDIYYGYSVVKVGRSIQEYTTAHLKQMLKTAPAWVHVAVNTITEKTGEYESKKSKKTGSAKFIQ